MGAEKNQFGVQENVHSSKNQTLLGRFKDRLTSALNNLRPKNQPEPLQPATKEVRKPFNRLALRGIVVFALLGTIGLAAATSEAQTNEEGDWDRVWSENFNDADEEEWALEEGAEIDNDRLELAGLGVGVFNLVTIPETFHQDAISFSFDLGSLPRGAHYVVQINSRNPIYRDASDVGNTVGGEYDGFQFIISNNYVDAYLMGGDNGSRAFTQSYDAPSWATSDDRTFILTYNADEEYFALTGPEGFYQSYPGKLTDRTYTFSVGVMAEVSNRVYTIDNMRVSEFTEEERPTVAGTNSNENNDNANDEEDEPLYETSFLNGSGEWEEILERNLHAEIDGGKLILEGRGFDEINFVTLPERFRTEDLSVTFSLDELHDEDDGYAVVEIQARGNNGNRRAHTYEAVRAYVSEDRTDIYGVANGQEYYLQTVNMRGIESNEFTLAYFDGDDDDIGQLEFRMGDNSTLSIAYLNLVDGSRQVSLGAFADRQTDISFRSVEVNGN